MECKNQRAVDFYEDETQGNPGSRRKLDEGAFRERFKRFGNAGPGGKPRLYGEWVQKCENTVILGFCGKVVFNLRCVFGPKVRTIFRGVRNAKKAVDFRLD